MKDILAGLGSTLEEFISSSSTMKTDKASKGDQTDFSVSVSQLEIDRNSSDEEEQVRRKSNDSGIVTQETRKRKY